MYIPMILRDEPLNHPVRIEPCLIRGFFKREQEKPSWLRQTSCLISCPCPKCRPGYL